MKNIMFEKLNRKDGSRYMLRTVKWGEQKCNFVKEKWAREDNWILLLPAAFLQTRLQDQKQS